jgi:hypothetical protein
MRREAVALALALCATAALAQLNPIDPDWREAEAPSPPDLRTDRLIPLEMPPSALRFGVDPASVSLGRDGIVRYVVVATSTSGAVNAMYEGIRCNTAEFKVYARYNPGSGWVRSQGEWRSLQDGALPSRHSLMIARTGACVGQGANLTAAQIVRDLGTSADRRFRPELR